MARNLAMLLLVAACLSCLSRQIPDFRALVADDECTDGTCAFNAMQFKSVKVAEDTEDVSMELSAEDMLALLEGEESIELWPFSGSGSMCCACKGTKTVSWSAGGKCTKCPKGTSKTVKPSKDCIKDKNGKIKKTTTACLSECQTLLKKKGWLGLQEATDEAADEVVEEGLVQESAEETSEEQEASIEISAAEMEEMQQATISGKVWPFSSSGSMCCACKKSQIVSWSAGGKCTKCPNGTSKTVKPSKDCIKDKNGKIKKTSKACLAECQTLLKKKSGSLFR